MLTEQTFDTGSVSINYAEGPRNGPPVVLLHGVTSRWQSWLTTIPVLSQRWHVVAADLRGHGRSGRVPGGYGIMEYAQDVIALIRHLDEGPAALIGQSLGSIITIGVASEAPDLVRAAILGDPPLGAFTRPPFTTRPEHDRFVMMRDLAREGLSPDEMRARMTAGRPLREAMAARTRSASLSQIDPDVLTLIIENRAIEGYDLEDRLGRIACPTLLFQGNEALGGALSDEDAEWAISLLRSGLLVRMPGAGHAIHLAPGIESVQYQQLVTDFLETV